MLTFQTLANTEHPPPPPHTHTHSLSLSLSPAVMYVYNIILYQVMCGDCLGRISTVPVLDLGWSKMAVFGDDGSSVLLLFTW